MFLQIKKELQKLSNPVHAISSARFFKTGKGQYGYGDKFLGITVPEQRKVAHMFWQASTKDIEKLLKSPYHEHRFVGLEILVAQFERGGVAEKKLVYNFYLKNTQYINNWDLVDTSAPYIVGTYVLNRPRLILTKLAKSKNMWERRIAIVATYRFIQNLDFGDTLKISQILITDPHDLIHKAVGWMLREVGKRDQAILEGFLKAHAVHMPRASLRYAIEKFPQSLRKKYLETKKTYLCCK